MFYVSLQAVDAEMILLNMQQQTNEEQEYNQDKDTGRGNEVIWEKHLLAREVLIQEAPQENL